MKRPVIKKAEPKPEPLPEPEPSAAGVVVSKVDIKSAEPVTLAAIDAGLRNRPRYARIQNVVAAHYGIARFRLVGRERLAHIVKPRQIAMYLCKEITKESLPKIGRRFGGKDHTTVLHACRKVERMMATDHLYAAEVAKLKIALTEN